MHLRKTIASAVAIQKQSYQLLRWLSNQIDSGLISTSIAHDDTAPTDAAHDWLTRHYLKLPDTLRPEPDQLRALSNYFGSYITTSFDLIQDPGTRLESLSDCYCAFCTRVIRASHLQPKKVTRRDKDIAAQHCIARIQQLATDAGFHITLDTATLLTKAQLRNAAYSAYGASLLDRINGIDTGPYVLALWRLIAWTPQGSPIKGFTLEAADIVAAEESLLAAIQQQAAA